MVMLDAHTHGLYKSDKCGKLNGSHDVYFIIILIYFSTAFCHL